MLDETSIPDSQKASIFIQFLINKFQPLGQSHAANWSHHLHNTWAAFSHCACSV